MSERKVLNKYYPPDFDPSKIPRMKLAKNRQYTVRLMAPFNMRCVTCGEYIYKGKKFNARKEDVEDQTYLGIRIYRFYIKCTRCLQEISFKTDPRNTDYEIEAGATRNFMALKLAEEQAKKELDELKEEEASNPMKLLENRTQQSRNEIELLESLEELKDLNRRQRNVDYDEMLMQYNTEETEREREERLAKLDEEYVKNVKFLTKSGGIKRVADEEIIEIEEYGKKSNLEVNSVTSTAPSTSATENTKTIVKNIAVNSSNVNNKFVKPTISVGGISNSKNLLKNLVKKKSNDASDKVISSTVTSTNSATSSSSASKIAPSSVAEKPKTSSNALSLLAGYDNDSDSGNSD